MSTRTLREPMLDRVLNKLNRFFLARLPIGAGLMVVLGVALVVRAHGPGPQGAAPVASPPGGTLLICGGGPLPEAVWGRFVELAGGRQARIVVIPTAHPRADELDPAQLLEPWARRGVASVQVLHTRSRAAADDPAFVRPLAEATGVWLGGGDQRRLSELYVDTAVERQLRALLDRGGVVGGTSAGAAIMTRVMIDGGRAEAIEGRGFDLLPGSIVDQHFLRRHRLRRLVGLLPKHPGLVGFGIDEGTALVVRDGRISVLGASCVVACVPALAGLPARLAVLKPGTQTDLATLRSADTASVAPPDLEALTTAAR